MRALSAIGFLISVFGLLLVIYSQLGVIPLLESLDNPDLKTDDFTIVTRQHYETLLLILSTWILILGVLAVALCSILYLKKNMRMTLIGTILGFIVAIFGVIQMWF
ncbi:MAG: hypothetical protein ACK479_05315 [Fluviicola sp.]|jgi:heme/copper-type cytochrome/quinol oxidase subunit 3